MSYAMFKCKSPMDQIRSDMPLIRELVETPRDLGLYLSKEGDAYKIRADYRDQKAGIEIGAVLNQLYNTDHYRKGEKFFGEIYN